MNLVNVLLIVTRFYGGINLGKGGLIRAYSKTAKDLLDNIELIEFIS
jgi:putative IMPACT (imprinted ancient) family translation regulator